MNFGLAREIYGIGAWSIDSKTLPAMLQILSNSKIGQNLELPERKYNSISFVDIKSNDDLDDIEERYDEDLEPTDEEIQGIAFVHLNGVITVDGGASSYGMTQVSERMLQLSRNENIKGFIVYANSGGGSTMAVELMTDAIAEIRKSKPVIALVRKGGMAASACYAILASCENIYCESEMSIVGSCGTMIQFEGREANTTDGEGEKHIRLYATKSVKKNNSIEEALNNNNYTLIINDLLNPINERFLSQIENNRTVLKGTDFDNGHDAFAKNSIGKFIDGIKSKSEVIKEVVSKIKNNTNPNINQNSNSKMTREELNQQHPALVQGIIQEGVTAERERVNSWMVYASADAELVTTGIESGKEISPSQREKLMVKMNSATMLNDLKSDSQQTISTTESKVEPEKVIAKNEELESAMNFNL